MPTASPAPAPADYFTDSGGALDRAIELGCSGYHTDSVNGSFYYVPCADSHRFDQLASGAELDFFGELCPTGGPEHAVFTSAITDLSLVASIIPPGSVAGNVVKPHSFIHLDRDKVTAPVPVYAPVDMELRGLAFYNTQVGTAEYLLWFTATCTQAVKFDHLSGLAESLAAVAPAEPADHSRTEGDFPPLQFKAGDVVGFTMGAGGTVAGGVGGAWDFGVYDTGNLNIFANPERFANGPNDSLHSVCPYDQFEDPLRAEYYGLFGSPSGKTVAGADCRGAVRDVAGTAAGWWFPEGSTEVENGFAIGDTLDGDVRMGGPDWSLSVQAGAATWADPESITTSHCYSSSGQFAFLEFLPGDGMAVAHGTGPCPASLPADHIVYVR
ncbi:MAG: hypothetical protein IIC93_12070 [Chloroflexi bacterium]|nr:hypothetical protein [Chloroflexota bacterium]